ncbi:MAG: DMT family transporter [Hyphomicrobiaceae bacterium]
MGWIWLIATIALEVVGSVMMKLSNSFTVLWPSVAVFVCYGAAVAGLTMVLKTIELSVAYAIWAGAGTALTAAIGIWWFGESATALKLASIALIIAGVVGLQLAGKPVVG